MATSGFLMMDLKGDHLLDDEIFLLKSHLVSGIILFSRNYKDKNQLKNLVENIKSIRSDLIVAVDQEGGRVQRFKGNGFSLLPEMFKLGLLYQKDSRLAKYIAYECGLVTGSELFSCHIDVNFAPVLDVNRHINPMLGSRCFGEKNKEIIDLSTLYIQGLHDAGVKAVGKHFPGHGGVREDTHISVSKDDRSMKEIRYDIQPFQAAIQNNIDGMMPSHVVYSQVSDEAAVFSSYWLQDILRKELAFNGVVFSDCLSMAAASVAGSIHERAQKALHAGCDILLVCNNPQGVKEVIDKLRDYTVSQSTSERIKILSQPRAVSQKVSKKRCDDLEKILIKNQLIVLSSSSQKKNVSPC